MLFKLAGLFLYLYEADTPWIVRSNATLLLWPIFIVLTCLKVLLLARRKEI